MSRLLSMENIHKSHDKEEICEKLFLGKSMLLIRKNRKDVPKESQNYRFHQWKWLLMSTSQAVKMKD